MNEGLADCGRASNARYHLEGCRCDACKRAERLVRKTRELRTAEGRPEFVDAEPARRRLAELKAMGYTDREIERISGVAHMTQYALTHRHWRTGEPVRRCRRETYEALMAVRGRSLTPGQAVDARAATALVRRWLQAGLPVAEVARVSGVDRQVLDALNHGERGSVQWRTLRALLAAKDELDARCARKPSDRPRKSPVRFARGKRVRATDVALMRRMRERGATYGEIAERTGFSASTVSAHLRKVAAA